MASEDPPERDMKDFEFIQLCKFKVSQSTPESPLNRSQLLASSSLFGLLFFASDEEAPGFKVVKTSELLAIDQSKGKERNKVTVTEFPIETKVTLSSSVEFLGISADDLTLAVVVKDAGQLNIHFFDVRSFANKPTAVLPFATSIVNASPNTSVMDLGWNPTVGSMLAVCLSDGNLLLLEVTGQAKVLASLPSSTGATCFSWSPKGKQLLVGKRDGSLAQYDHSLAEKKQWPSLSILTTPQTVIDVVWISTYSFLAGYLSVGAPAADQPIVVLTQSNKENITKYIKFDDPCFGNGEDRKPHFLFHFVQKWEMVIMASSRASEATIIGKNLDDKVSWEHWNLDDCARAELPLTSNQNDSYPLGLAVDYSPQNQVVLSETKTLPPCPVIFILSNDGLLLSYHLSYAHKDAPQVTTVPQAMDPSAARKGAPGLVSRAAQQPTLPALAPSTSAPFGTPVSQPQAQQSQVPQAHSPQTPSLSVPSAAFSTPAVKPGFNFTGANQTPKPGDLFPSGQKPPPAFAPSLSQPSQPSLVPSNAAAPSFSFSMGGQGASKGPSSAFVSLSPATASASPQQAQAATNFGQPALPQASVQQPPNLQPKPSALPDAGVNPQSLPIGGAQKPPPSTSAPFTGLFGLQKKPGETQAEGKVPGVSPGHPSQNLPRTASEIKPAIPPQGPRFPPPATLAAPASQPVPSSGSSPSPFGGQPGMGAPLVGQPGIGVGAPPAYPSQQADKPIVAQVRDMGTSGVSHQGEESNSTIKATVDSAFIQNITEEIADFELEMRQLMDRSKQKVKSVGSTSELHSLRQDIEKISSFVTDIKDVTKEQTKESQDLKSACYNLLYLAEECSTLYQRNNDPHYHSLLQGRALDPVSAGKLKSLQQMAQSIESTVVDADHVLDSHWNDHLNREKEKMTTTAGDTIYKTIKNNHWLINDQRGRLEKLEEQIRCLRLQSKAKQCEKGSPFKLLPDSSQTPNAKASPSLKTPTTTMTPEKLSRLKDYLLQRKVPVVKPTTPADLSMSRIISQSAKKTPTATNLKMAAHQPGDTQQMRPQNQSTPQSKWLPSNMNQHHQQTPTGVPPAQLRLAKGNVPEASNLPAMQKGAGVPMAPGQLLKMGQGMPDGSFPPRSGLPMQPPTAFSGVAYFKQPQLPPVAMGQGIVAGQQIPPEVQAAAQVLSTHMGSAMRPDGPLAHIPQLLSAAAASGKPLAQLQQLKMQNMYEDITPTETDETNDDDEDDDYDEEDNGYEDEDEDEEEVGLRPGFDMGVPAFSDPKAIMGGGNVSASQSPHQLGASVAPKNLFGSSKFTSPPLGGDDQGNLKATSPNTADGKPSVFSPPKFGAMTTNSFNFGFTTSAPTTASSTSALTVFSGKPTTKPAFSFQTFGGTAVFGQKAPPMPAATSGDGNVFGSLATPSKSVGFGDLTSHDTKPGVQTKPGLTVSQPSGAPKDAPDAGSKVGTTTMSPSSLPFSSSAATSPSAPALISSSPLTAFSFGGSKDPSAQSGTGSTPLFGAQTKAPSDEAIKTSPFAGQPAQTGFSIFGGNKAASPPGSKSGFDAVFSATSPPVKTTASGFSFSPNAYNLSCTGRFFGSQPASEADTVSSTGTEAAVSTTGTGQAVNLTPTKTTTVDVSPIPQPLTSTPVPSKEDVAQKPFQDAASLSSTTTVSAAGDASTTAPTLTALMAQPSPSTSNPVATSSSSGFTFGGVGAAPNTPVFGGKSTAPVSSTVAASPFGNAAQTTSVAGSPFGSAAQTTAATTASSFGIAPQTTTASTASPIGNAAQTTAATTASPFGNAAQTTVTTASLFGNAAQTATANTTSPFGNAAQPDTQSATNLGTTAASAAFGSQSAATTTFGGIFGATPSAATTSASTPLFGTTTSTTPLFGSTAPTTVSTSLFSSGDGNVETSSTQSFFTGTSVFGSKTPFGTSTTTTTGTPVFGGGGSFATTAATSTGSPLFGGGSTTSAPSVPSFGFGASSQASGGGLFGASSSTSDMSAVGGGSLFSKPAGGLFGSPSTSGSFFDQSSTPSTSQTGSVFGQPPSTASSLGFGQGGQATSLFGGSGEGFGLGGKPSEEKAKQNVFGSATQTFGSENTEQSSLFGSGGSSSFGTLGMGSSFNNVSGGFSSGTQSGVSSTGFGVSATPASSSGFGAPPTFGGTPTFGSPGFGSGSFGGSKPTFGSSPSFGGGAGFGTAAPFSSPGTSGVFGSASSENNAFGSFASASAPSFGQLAQSSSTNAFGGSESGFGSSQTPVFGSAGGGGGGGGSGSGAFGSFGASPGFGQASPAPSFGTGQSPGFGGSSFGSSPAFSSYRG